MALEIPPYHSWGRTALTLGNIAAVDNIDMMEVNKTYSCCTDLHTASLAQIDFYFQNEIHCCIGHHC